MKNLILISCVLALLSLSFSSESQAKQTRRDGKWEASFQLLNSLSTDISGENGSSVDSDIGWGFTLGYIS